MENDLTGKAGDLPISPLRRRLPVILGWGLVILGAVALPVSLFGAQPHTWFEVLGSTSCIPIGLYMLCVRAEDWDMPQRRDRPLRDPVGAALGLSEVGALIEPAEIFRIINRPLGLSIAQRTALWWQSAHLFAPSHENEQQACSFCAAGRRPDQGLPI